MVRDIVNSYRSANTLHRVVSELCESPEFNDIFCSSLKQDLHVICQRSQILAHGEITAIQKAFAVLMEKKEDLIPAVELYVDEILGLKFVSEADRDTILRTMIQTRHSILDQAFGSKPNQNSTAGNPALPSSSQSAPSDHKPVSEEQLFVSDGSEGSRTSDLPHIAGQHERDSPVDWPGAVASEPNGGDEKLKRLFIVYHKAKQDFDATPAKTLERTKSAKFLRDTTENCLAYIAAKRTRPGTEITGDGTMLELRATLEETMAIAEQGSGGKKRRFDEKWENIPQEPARMRGPAPQPLANSDPVPRGRTSEIKRGPITSRVQKHSRRSDLPHRLYPASAGQSVRRVFGDGYKPHAEGEAFNGRVYGDRYRPTYR